MNRLYRSADSCVIILFVLHEIENETHPVSNFVIKTLRVRIHALLLVVFVDEI